MGLIRVGPGWHAIVGHGETALERNHRSVGHAAGTELQGAFRAIDPDTHHVVARRRRHEGEGCTVPPAVAAPPCEELGAVRCAGWKQLEQKPLAGLDYRIQRCGNRDFGGRTSPRRYNEIW